MIHHLPELPGGTRVEFAVQTAIELAKLLGGQVRFVFNDAEITVQMNDDPAEVVEAFHKQPATTPGRMRRIVRIVK